MKVSQGIGGLPEGVRPSVCTIGVFDGVHRGHQALMGRVVEVARERDATPVVVTFDRHPLELIAPGKEPPLITTPRQRAEAMEEVGIELLLVLRFDDALRHLTAEEFVQHVIDGALGAVHVVVGGNFRFGHEHAGTVDRLREMGTTHGFTVEVVDLIFLDGHEPVSSTVIRNEIREGRVDSVATKLGRPFRLEGLVERGAGRGAELGFPTANLRVAEKMLLPKIGVYAGWLIRRGRRYPAVVDVGLNPTFEDRRAPLVEAHVLDFQGDLYGEVVGIEFTHHLRDEVKFESATGLVEAIRGDIDRARELLGLREIPPAAREGKG